jgi:DNA-binding NtrC family response regulator
MDILVVDDDPGIRVGVACPLLDAGHRVIEARDGVEAIRLVSTQVFDVAVCDVRLPKIDGLTLFRRIHADSPRTAVILMTAYANISDAVAALKEGAYDYITKPFDTERLTTGIIRRIAEQRELEQELREAREQLSGLNASAIIGRSPTIVRLHELIETVAESDAPVLLTGESGTGKELIARTLHQCSRRRQKPFVVVNCAALPEALLEAELFGHERGAFTGALKKRDGRFKIADGGTLLLDEVAEISPSAQTKLLRVLQEGTIEPIGSNTSLHIDVRVISATHQNLKQMIADKRFREDLYYRLNVLDLTVPPLRERPGDLPILFQHFLRQFTPFGKPTPTISRSAWTKLSKHAFPGNVRELAHAVERAVVLSRGGEIDLAHLPPDIVGPLPTAPPSALDFQPLARALKEFERERLLQALALADGTRTRAAELLGISRKSLWEKLRAHGIVGGDSEPAPPGEKEERSNGRRRLP